MEILLVNGLLCPGTLHPLGQRIFTTKVKTRHQGLSMDLPPKDELCCLNAACWWTQSVPKVPSILRRLIAASEGQGTLPPREGLTSVSC